MESQNNSAGSDLHRLAHGGGVEIAALYHSFGRGNKRENIIAGCSLQITEGKLTVVIGPSGCGKSTLAKLIAGYLTPDDGRIRINGRHVKGPGNDRLMVFQESALFPWMSNEENALFGLRASGNINTKTKNMAFNLLERVGLFQFKDKFPLALSGGMQRRLEMVRALVNEPELFILDEPFRGLDAMTRTLMQEHFAKMFEEGRRTALFITTDIDEAILLADRIVIMSNKPMSVAEIIEIDIPRPRTIADLFKNDRANEIKKNIVKILYIEALKSFEGTKKAAVMLKGMGMQKERID